MRKKLIMDPLTAALAEIESNGGLEKTESVKSGMCSVFDNILFVPFDNFFCENRLHFKGVYSCFWFCFKRCFHFFSEKN